MATLAVMIPRIFDRAWRRYGQPVMTVVKPLVAWALPAGFAYDADIDAIRNSGGTVLPNPEDYWLTDTVYIVPTGRTADLDVLIAAGIVPSGTVNVYILNTDAATVRAAHAVQIDGAWYDVIEVAGAPVGSGGIWHMVTLRRRS